MKTLFALLLIITLAATAWMSWIASDFKRPDGTRFSIMNLELPTDGSEATNLIAGFDAGTYKAVVQQLNADYIFMAGCYSAILVLCLIAVRRITDISVMQKDLRQPVTGNGWKRLLLALAILQLFAWGLDVWKNAQIEQWLQANIIDDNIPFFKARVYFKFGIGIAGFLTAAAILLLTGVTLKNLTTQKLTHIAANPEEQPVNTWFDFF